MSDASISPDPNKIRNWPWPNSAQPDWLFDMDLVVLDGRPQPIGLVIKRAPDRAPQPITGKLLRTFPLAAMTRAAASGSGAQRLAIEEEAEGFVATLDAADQQRLEAAQRNLGNPNWTPYADPRDTSFFLYLADLYRTAENYSRRPAHLIAVLLEANPSTTRGWISRARQLRYLPQQARSSNPLPHRLKPEEVTD